MTAALYSECHSSSHTQSGKSVFMEEWSQGSTNFTFNHYQGITAGKKDLLEKDFCKSTMISSALNSFEKRKLIQIPSQEHPIRSCLNL